MRNWIELLQDIGLFLMILFLLGYCSDVNAAHYPWPLMRAEYTAIQNECIAGLAEEDDPYLFVYRDYCGCVAQEIIGEVKDTPEYLKDDKYLDKMRPIIAAAYEYCDQYWEWKQKNVQPVQKKKPIKSIH